MAKQRVINTYFWSDDFILDLRADEKLLFLYVLTNPQTDLCGAYQIAMRKMVFETNLTEKRILVILTKFADAGKVFYEDGWMIVRNFAKHQVQNPKVRLGIERSLINCPDWVKDRLSKPIDTLRKGVTLLPELLPELEPTDDEPRATSFAEQVLDGIRSELGILQMAKEPDWLIEIEHAQKNGFSVEHCIETFVLMNKQDWRDTAIRAGTWAEQLPILYKLRTERERKNGKANKSAAERSGDRAVNAVRLANAVAEGDTDTIASILGSDDSTRRKGYLSS